MHPSAYPRSRADALLDAYRTALAEASAAAPVAPSGFDELVAPDGVRLGSEGLVAALADQGHRELERIRRRAERYIDDDGVTYGTAPEGGVPGPWRIDPLPVFLHGAEWAQLERGLEQRARLLQLVLDDVYGEQRLLRERRIPAEVVLGHRGYVRAAAGIPAERRPLIATATDLGRDAEGRWTVFDDRTQAPSGAGYAMATRRIVAQLLPRLHRITDVAKLRGFFHTMTAAILAAAPDHDAVPRTVLLSPGPGSETAFDQAFTASLLGFPLVEADDLQVRAGRIWLRASHGLVPIDARCSAASTRPGPIRSSCAATAASAWPASSRRCARAAASSSTRSARACSRTPGSCPTCPPSPSPGSASRSGCRAPRPGGAATRPAARTCSPASTGSC